MQKVYVNLSTYLTNISSEADNLTTVIFPTKEKSLEIYMDWTKMIQTKDQMNRSQPENTRTKSFETHWGAWRWGEREWCWEYIKRIEYTAWSISVQLWSYRKIWWHQKQTYYCLLATDQQASILLSHSNADCFSNT